jgi:DNA-binding NarL/FixJ family response regulator
VGTKEPGVIKLLVLDGRRSLPGSSLRALYKELGIERIDHAGSPEALHVHVEQNDFDAILACAEDLRPEDVRRLLAEGEQGRRPRKVVIVEVPRSQELILDYIESGAAGYALHGEAPQGLARRVRAVIGGQALLCPDIASALMRRIAQRARVNRDGRPLGPLPDGGPGLSPREQEVLELIRRGLSNREIAQCLCIEVGTVKNHVHSILSKLEVNSRFEAAARAGPAGIRAAAPDGPPARPGGGNGTRL